MGLGPRRGVIADVSSGAASNYGLGEGWQGHPELLTKTNVMRARQLHLQQKVKSWRARAQSDTRGASGA